MRRSRTAAGAGLALVLAIGTWAGGPARAAVQAPGSGDITALITANGGRNNIVLNGGDYTITIPASGPIVQEEPDLPPLPETIYRGVISGTGTVTVRPPAGGRATLVMTNTNTWSLPTNRLRSWTNKQPFAKYQYDGVTLNGGRSPWDVHVLHGGTNDPAMTIAKGAVVNLSDLDGPRANLESFREKGGKTGLGTYNLDTVRVDGTLVFTNNRYGSYDTTVPTLVGTGDFINHHGGFRMSGINTISGSVLVSGANINGGWARAELTGVSRIYNGQDLAYGATPETIAPAGQTESSPGVEVVPQTLYECCYGNAFYNIGSGELRLTGKYSFTDTTDQLHPSLSNSRLNYVAMPKGDSHRILDLGGITTFGDGSDADFWLPSGWGNTYIATRNAYAIGFDYNGTVRMNTPINRPEEINGANLFIRGTKGNHVIVTQRLLYHGFTKIDQNAVLQFGDGTIGNKDPNFSYTNVKRGWTITGTYSTSSGSGSLLTADVPMGAPSDRIINDGTLVIANANGAYSGVGPLSLSDISGRGALQQKGPAPLTLLSHLSYTGATKVISGTLVLSSSKRGRASLASSSGVQLAGKKARLDISPAGAQTIKGLSGVAGSQVRLGGRKLIINARGNAVFAGTITDGGIRAGTGGAVVKGGKGTLTLVGALTSSGPLTVRAGSIDLRGSSTHQVRVAGTVSVAKEGSLEASSAQLASLSNSGRTTMSGALTARNGFIQSSTGVLDVVPAAGTSALPSLSTAGPVSLAGTLHLSGTPAAGRHQTLINNTGKNAVRGTFTGVPEGSTLKVGNTTVTVSYRGGDGNDVVLSTAFTAAADTGPANLGSSLLSAGNAGTGGHAAVAGASLLSASLLLVAFFYRRRRAAPPVEVGQVAHDTKIGSKE